jgi:hypothetical protein
MSVMAFHTQWVNEPYIIETQYAGHVSGSEVDMNMLEYLGIVQSQPAYILLDLSKVETLPNQLLQLSSLGQVITHANTAWLAIVMPGQPEYVRTTRMLARDKVKLFPDRVNALSFLRAMVRTDTGIVL